MWWKTFAESLNGTSIIESRYTRHRNGVGCVRGMGVWGLVRESVVPGRDHNIATKELLPITVAAVIWGQDGRGTWYRTTGFSATIRQWWMSF